jgi:hypothetical protein
MRDSLVPAWALLSGSKSETRNMQQTSPEKIPQAASSALPMNFVFKRPHFVIKPHLAMPLPESAAR